jgi:hypothetical protein
MLLAAWGDVLQLAGFEARVQVVRLREEGGKKEAETDNKPQSPYVKFAWPQVEKLNTTVVGFEIECRGAAVYDFLRLEGGVWRLFEGDRKSDIWVSVRPSSLAQFQTPVGVHRQHFFDALPVHRQVKDGQLIDPDASWRCEFPDATAWQRALDRQFEALMGRMLLGEDA